jgi:hypothetical protein
MKLVHETCKTRKNRRLVHWALILVATSACSSSSEGSHASDGGVPDAGNNAEISPEISPDAGSNQVAEASAPMADGGGDEGAPAASAAQAAADAATAVCNAYGRCSMFVVQRLFGSLSACTSAFTTKFTNALSASGTGETPAIVESCVAKASNVSCADLFGNNLPTECAAVPGQLANGSPCGEPSQCQSAYCNIPSDSNCGACGAPPTAGDSCRADSNCPSGTLCSSAGSCVAPGKAGDACDSTSRPCNLTLACKNGTCAHPDEAGAVCTSGSCDAAAGTFCSSQTATCEVINFADAGKPCSRTANDITLCSANGTCELPASTSTAGTCRAAVEPGGDCDSTNGPYCLEPAACVNGVCTIPSAAGCH